MKFALIDTSSLKSEKVDDKYLDYWRDEIDRRKALIDQLGTLATPLVVYQDGFDEDYQAIFEVPFSDSNTLNFIAMYELHQENPRQYELVNAWLCEHSGQAEVVIDQMDEMSFTFND
ncbi:MAG: hypothetical protein HC907_14980 [Richelia sp. SM1_7_0]|nr:hypothetical protein [Richelia sp. SM1_7_0]